MILFLAQSGHLSEDSNFNTFLFLCETVFAWETLTTELKITEQLVSFAPLFMVIHTSYILEHFVTL